MNDPFSRVFGLPTRSLVITPHNTNPIAEKPDYIYVGTTGDIAMRLPGDAADVTLKNCLGGLTLMVAPTHIRATGTTATGLVGLFYK